MGPRSAERGSPGTDELRSEPASWLQWGHVRLNVEITLTNWSSLAQLASMGPRSAERGSRHFGGVEFRIRFSGATLAERGSIFLVVLT